MNILYVKNVSDKVFCFDVKKIGHYLFEIFLFFVAEANPGLQACVNECLLVLRKQAFNIWTSGHF